MDRVIYDRMAQYDSQHWWYLARRDIIASVIERKITLPADARLLEIGCGTGHNLPMLSRFGNVDAVEIDEEARRVASQRLGREVYSAPLPTLEGIEAGKYDLVALLDVLEHVEADVDALKSIVKRLRPGGRILVTVPAFPFLWSAHDVVNHHYRRYTRASLTKVLGDAGLTLSMLSWFNSILFPCVATARLWGKMRHKDDSDDALPAPPVNRMLRRVFGIERHLIGRIPMTPGVSLMAIVSA